MKQMRQTHLFFDTLIVSPKRKHIKYLYYILCHTLKAYLFKVYSAILCHNESNKKADVFQYLWWL